MVWIIMKKDASHKPKPSVTIDYKAGERYNVPTAIADALASTGAVEIERRKNNRTEKSGTEVTIASDNGEG